VLRYKFINGRRGAELEVYKWEELGVLSWESINGRRDAGLVARGWAGGRQRRPEDKGWVQDAY